MLRLKEIQDSFYRRLLDIRNMEYLLGQEAFQKATQGASTEDVKNIEILTDLCFHFEGRVRVEAISLLRAWVKERNFTDHTIRDLREHARVLGINRYSRLSKSELLSQLAKKASTNGTGTHLQDFLNTNGHSHAPFSKRVETIFNSIQSVPVGEIRQ